MRKYLYRILLLVGLTMAIGYLLNVFSSQLKDENSLENIEYKYLLADQQLDSLYDYNFEKAEQERRSIYKSAIKAGDSLNLMRAFYYKVVADLQNNRTDSILYFSEQILDYSKSNNNSKHLKARVDILLGQYYFLLDNYSKSLEFYLEALFYFEKETNAPDLTNIYNGLGNIHSQLEDKEKGISYYKKAYEVSVHTNNLKGQAIYYGNIGRMQLNNKNYEESKKSIFKGIGIFEKLLDNRNIVKCYVLLNRLENELGNTSTAMSYNDKAYEISQKINDQASLVLTYLSYGDTYLRIYDTIQAVEYYEKGYKTSIMPKTRLYAQKKLAEITKYSKQYKKAYTHLELYYSINDSIIDNKIRQRVEELKWDHIFKEQRYENELLHNKVVIEQQKRYNQTKTYVVIIFSTLGLGGILVLLYRNNKKSLLITTLKNTQLEEKIKTETTLQKVQIQKHELELRVKTELQLLQEKQHEFELKSQLAHQELIEKQHQSDLEYKNRELTSISVQLLSKNKIFSEIEEVIKNKSLTKDRLFYELKRTIKNNRNQDKDWKQFQIIFKKTHPDFFKNLYALYPNLTEAEVRVCTYIKIKMTNYEIAFLLGINQSSLVSTRYRIRKKMNLASSQNLDEVISKI